MDWGSSRFTRHFTWKLFVFLKPVIAALLAVAILGNDLTLIRTIAIILVVFSVAAEFLVGRFSKIEK